MRPAVGLATAVGAVAAPIAAVDMTLSRTGRPLLSHLWWAALDDPTLAPATFGVWTVPTYHLFRPRRPWEEAIAAGVAVAAACRLLSRTCTRTLRGCHIP